MTECRAADTGTHPALTWPRPGPDMCHSQLAPAKRQTETKYLEKGI